MNRRRYLLSCLYSEQYRNLFLANLYHDIIPNTIADRKARNNGKTSIVKIEGNGEIENQLVANGDFSNGDNWQIYDSNYGAISFSNHKATITITNNVGSAWWYLSLQQTYLNFVQGHKLFVSVNIESSNISQFRVEPAGANSVDVGTGQHYIFTTLSNIYNHGFLIFPIANGDVGNSFNVSNVYIVDLTIRFGTGNEPTSLNDNRIKKIIADGYKPKNEGTMKSSIVESVETKGFNIWDEEWGSGKMDAQGIVSATSHAVISKNYIKVLPNTEYYLLSPQNCYLVYFDNELNFIGSINPIKNETFTTPSNCSYIRFNTWEYSYEPPYNHDICINRSGARNGEYVPHRWQDFYQQVEYIESTGTQYIDSGVALGTTWAFDIKLSVNDIGTYKLLTQGNYGLRLEGARIINFALGQRYAYSNSVASNTIYQCIGNNTSLTVNGENATAEVDSDTPSGNVMVLHIANAKVYACKLYGNGTLVRDFIPVYNKLTGEIGLLDLVENKFYGNAGTGTFSKGADVPNNNAIKLPAPLQLDGAINAHNTFEITKTEFVFTRNVWRLDLGALEWRKDGADYNFYSNFISDGGGSSSPILSSKYTYHFGAYAKNLMDNKSIGFADDHRLYCRDDDYNDASAFTTALTGVPLYYQLPTPQVISIPRKHLKAVDLGSLSWGYDSSSYLFYSTTNPSDIKNAVSHELVANIWCPIYITKDRNSMSSDMSISLQTNGQVIIKNTKYTDENYFKTAMSGVYLFYETIYETDVLLDSGLPKEYQRVEYVKADTYSYIDTGYKIASENMKVEFGCGFGGFLAVGTSLFGSNSDNNYDLVPYYSSAYGTRTFKHWVGTTGDLLDVAYNEENNKVIYTAKNGTLTCLINGASHSASYSGSIISGVNVFIFGKNGNGTSQERGDGYKLNYFKLYDNDVLVRDFVPCYRKADGVIGLYDRVTRQFFVNQGAGALLKGADVYDNVNEEMYQRGGEINARGELYDEVEYIESSGTQYIDTGVAQQPIDVKLELSTPAVVVNGCFIGVSTSSSNNDEYQTGVLNNYPYIVIGLAKTQTQTLISLNNKSILSARFGITYSLSLDGNIIFNDTNGKELTSNYTFNLFRRGGNMVETDRFYSSYQLYNAQMIKLNGELVRDFVPCIRKRDGVAGLFDKVTGKFFTNQGTGTFATGSFVRTFDDNEVLPNYEGKFQVK